jgi:hypothetical protein
VIEESTWGAINFTLKYTIPFLLGQLAVIFFLVSIGELEIKVKGK